MYLNISYWVGLHILYIQYTYVQCELLKKNVIIGIFTDKCDFLSKSSSLLVCWKLNFYVHIKQNQQNNFYSQR